MTKKTTYQILIIAIVALVGLYFYNKYNVAPSIQVDKLEILNEDSTKFDIQSLKGKKVIISFYASWCPNCIDELKVLNTIKNEKLSDIEILAITDESMDKLISFKNRKQYPFTFLKLNASFPEIGIVSIPTTYLLNTKGEIVYNKVGYIEWDDESNLNHLKSLME
jgi:peroxiredoxin